MPKFLSPLNEEQVRAIHADRRGYTRIAVEYGVSRQTVSNIKTGNTWKHLKLPRLSNKPTKYDTYKKELEARLVSTDTDSR